MHDVIRLKHRWQSSNTLVVSVIGDIPSAYARRACSKGFSLFSRPDLYTGSLLRILLKPLYTGLLLYTLLSNRVSIGLLLYTILSNRVTGYTVEVVLTGYTDLEPTGYTVLRAGVVRDEREVYPGLDDRFIPSKIKQYLRSFRCEQ